MEIHYRKEINGNYLMIQTGQEGPNQYIINMLKTNKISGLLSFKVNYLDQKEMYCYDITSKQSLNQLFKHRSITLEEIRQIILQLGRLLETIEKFLIKEEVLLLDKDYIYVDQNNFTIYLCAVPGYQGDFFRSLSELMQFMLQTVNDRNTESVILAYSLFQQSLKETYVYGDLMNIVSTTLPPLEKEEHHLEKQVEPSDKTEWSLKGTDKKALEENQRPWFGTILFMVAVPIALWILRGTEVIKSYLIYLAGWELLCLLFLFFPFKKNKKEETNRFELQTTFEYEQEERPKQLPTNPVSHYVAESEPCTVLLTDLGNQTGIRKLISLDEKEPDIDILYFPFIIGKQSESVDYQLDKSTVSRFHLRLDFKNDKYYITDLGSMNGTKVRGELIEKETSVEICLEDIICISNFGYRFR